MKPYYQNKYRVSSARRADWDYGTVADYFVTICTHSFKPFFGKITEGVMHLSEVGELVQEECLKTFEIRSDLNLERGQYIIMPNHFHAIISIGPNKFNKGSYEVDDSLLTDAIKQGPQSNNLSAIIRGFKSSVTAKAKKYILISSGRQDFTIT